MTSQVSQFLEACVRGRINILVSGGTGAGKTTTLNVLSSFIPDDERIITIEDAAELQLQQPHVVRLESRPPNIEGKGQVTIRDLVRNSLRMRPDRIVVGEVRGAEALDMLQAMNTGHDGSISHDPLQLAARLAVAARDHHDDGRHGAVAEVDPRADRLGDPADRAPAAAEGRHAPVHPRHRGRRAWRATSITLQDIFLFDFAAGMDEEGKFRGRLKSTGLRPKFLDKLEERGVYLDAEIFALDSRGND